MEGIRNCFLCDQKWHLKGKGWTAGWSLPFLRPQTSASPPPAPKEIPQTKLVLNITNTYWHEVATTTLFDLIKGYHILTPNFKFKWN